MTLIRHEPFQPPVCARCERRHFIGACSLDLPKKGEIRCASCRQAAKPSRRDSIYCKDCATDFEAKLQAAPPEDTKELADDIFARIERNNGRRR